MTRFAKDQMLDELRTILLFEADHHLLTRGLEGAVEYIGFRPGEDGEYCHRNPSDVNLSRFRITAVFERGYDFAFRPSVLNTLEEHEVQDLTVFMLGTPRSGGILSGGETHQFMTSEGRCQAVADAAMARWKLECDPPGAGAHTFTTRELALLADMTEGAIRNALSDKSESGLRALPGSRNPVEVEHAEAWRWLKGRRGFIPMPNRPRTDRFLLEQLQNIRSAEALGRLVRDRVLASFASVCDAADRLGWSATDLELWLNGDQEFEARRAQALADALDLDVPVFVGKALEVSLRRDLAGSRMK